MARASKKSSTAEIGSRYALALTRIMLGFVFLWAFLDKLLGLYFSTTPAKAWLNGGSPTKGFLMGVKGPFADTFHSFAGQGWADWLFMAAVLCMGVALILGIGLRLAAIGGSALLILMWLASQPLQTNPVIDDHLVYVGLLWVIYFGATTQVLSIAGWWRSTALGRSRWLQ